jgi:hypothetical protein
MDIKFPELNKRAGVHYAVTDDGAELPVIDVTHPAFRLDPTPEEMDRRTGQFLKTMRRMGRNPAFLRKAIWRIMSRRSRLAAGLARSAGGVLDNMTTYLMKLGPANLPAGYATRTDREVAETLNPFCARLRLQYLAHLIADGLAPGLEARSGAALHLVDIAGGPASDSLNALIVLNKERPALLAGRAVHIHVLDPDAAGPSFGRRALAALTAPGGPLAGLDPAWEHRTYDWGKPEPLERLLVEIGSGAVVSASSEGGLFEYGSDLDVGANLKALSRRAMVGQMCGTVLKDNDFVRLAHASIGPASVSRSREAFIALAEGAGWRLDAERETPFNYAVRLRRAAQPAGGGAGA